jgi:TRAP-type C4-dicarboxylate transport system substrate-binding protein
MKTKILLVLLASLLVISLVAVSCGSPREEEVITLKFNDWGPPGIGIGELHQQAAAMIEERTNGKVKVECYFSQSLLSYGDTLTGVSEGIADITLYVVGATPGVHQLHQIFGLPFIGDIPDMRAGAAIYTQLLKDYDEFDEENATLNVKWLSIRVMPPSQFHSVTDPVRTLDDIQGMKIITGVGPLADMLDAYGAASMQLGPPDWATSLERGLAQAQITHWAAVHDFQLTDLFSSHTNFGGAGMGMVPIGFLVNLDTWNKLTSSEQQVLIDVYDWVNEESLNYDIDLVGTAVDQAAAMGHTMIELSQQEIAQWAAAVQPFVDDYLDETEALGWAAWDAYNGLKKLIEDYSD